MVQKYTKSEIVKLELKNSLARSAGAYLRIGLTEFYKIKKIQFNSAAASAIGNLGIGIELLLKSTLCGHNPALIFTDMPTDVKLMWIVPDLPDEIEKKINLNDLRAFTYKTIEINECIGLFYLLHPKEQQNYKPYFRLLSKIRNQSVHSALPSFQLYELDRVAYLAMQLIEYFNTINGAKSGYILTEADKNYLKSYNKNRVQRVHDKVEKAKAAARNLGDSRLSIADDSWDMHVVECPVCESDAVVYGNTEIDIAQDAENEFSESLDFFADTFECEECGLKLDDPEELKLADIALHYDRSSELHQWHRDHQDHDVAL